MQTRLVLLSLVFLAVPVLIYDQFRQADEANQLLLLESAGRQGALIARALEPQLAATARPDLPRIGAELARLADDRTRLKLLLRPDAIGGAQGFFYVGAAPSVPTADLDFERYQLMQQGVLGRLAESCGGNQPLALRVPRPTGEVEVLTSIIPIRTALGCWALVTSHTTADYVGSSLGRPYWRMPNVQAAALIYLAVAALVLMVLLGVWRNLRRFRDLARTIIGGEAGAGSFAERNTVPELAGVAEDFDRLVDSLRHSAESLRRAAEDNAHAFKTPIAVIRQSVEPLKRTLPAGDARCQRALSMIERSVDKLDGLVSFARRMDEATADLLEPPRRRVNLSDVLERLANGYTGLFAERHLHIRTSIASGVVVRASEELLETVIENIIENAVSFSPIDGTVRVTLVQRGKAAELTVEDDGPGVDPANLPRIFERYFSHREPGNPGANAPIGAESADSPPTPNPAEGTHFGIGLWIVRRNIEAVGGTVLAENRETRGFRMRIRLPVAG